MAIESKTDIIAMGEQWLRKAPALPTNVREGLVKITPILSLVFGILGILFGVHGLFFMTLSPYAYHVYGLILLAALLSLISSVMLLLAYKGTNRRQYRGWTMLFWAEVVTVISQLVMFNILGAIIGGLIAFYLLYQIKSYYK